MKELGRICCLLLACLTGVNSKPPHIVFILADDLGKCACIYISIILTDDLGVYIYISINLADDLGKCMCIYI